jgi:hypothetical protein
LWDRIDAGAFEGILRTGTAAWFRYAQFAKGRVDQTIVGRSARIVVTMGMPAFIYCLWFGAHGLKSLTQNLSGRHYADTINFDRHDPRG